MKWRQVYEVEGIPEVITRDGGCAKIATVWGEGDPLFVRVQSYDESDSASRGGAQPQHPVFDSVVKQGKRLRVVIFEEDT